MSGGLVVTGGADGIEARVDDLAAAGHLLLAAGYRMRDAADACGWPLLMAEPDDAAGQEVQFLARTAVATARGVADDAQRLGRFLAAAALAYSDTENGLLHRLAAATAGLFTTGWHLLALPAEFAVDWARTRDPGAAFDDAATRNVAMLDFVLACTVATLPGLRLMLRLEATPDGSGVATATGPDRRGAAARPPRSLADLVGELDRRDHGPPGAIDVRLLRCADGRRRVIVDITGTKDFFGTTGPDVTDLTTNARALIGRDTAYEQGVFAALRNAGVRPGDKVMLVGHSQGGMVAVTAARDAAAQGFDVTHVITAGSPIGASSRSLPKDIQVLALENRRDAVPHLDARDNPDSVNVTTVGFDAGPKSFIDEHGIGTSYVPGARLADASDDPAIRAFLDSAAGYFRATDVRTETYVISRTY